MTDEKSMPQKPQWENWMIAQIITAPTLTDRVLMMDRFIEQLTKHPNLQPEDLEALSDFGKI